MFKIFRILFIFLSIALLQGQTAEELKRFMNTYEKLKADQEANEIVKKGIESEKDVDEGPVRLLIEPGDIFVLEPKEIADPIFHEDCKIVCVKKPSIIGDKFEVL